MNISISKEIRRVYCVAKTPSPLFLAVSLAPLLLHSGLSDSAL